MPRLGPHLKGEEDTKKFAVESLDIEIAPDSPLQPDNTTASLPVVVAKLLGAPVERSAEAMVSVQVADASEYRWKLVTNADLCKENTDFSDWVAVSQPIVIDQKKFPDNQALVLCVLGRDSNSNVQGLATVARWLWQPAIPCWLIRSMCWTAIIGSA